MAGLTSANVVSEDLRKKFSFKNSQELMASLLTFNCESQAVAIDSSPADSIKTTGTKAMFLNGQVVVCAAVSDFDFGADSTEVTKTAWAGATAYVVGDIRWASAHGDERLRCIAAHTSVANVDDTVDAPANEPYVSANWDNKWEVAPHSAVNAVDASITKAYDQWFMITAQADGSLNIWEAGDEVITSTGAECKPPQTDTKKYVPIGFLHVLNATSSPFIMGTTAFSTSSITDTFINVTGPVMPHSDNWDKN